MLQNLNNTPTIEKAESEDLRKDWGSEEAPLQNGTMIHSDMLMALDVVVFGVVGKWGWYLWSD